MAPLKTNVKCKHFTRGKHCRRNVSSHFSPSTFRFYSNIAKAFRLAAFYVCFVKNIFLVGRVPRLLSQNAEYAVVPVLCFYSSSSTSSCSCSCFSWLFFLFMFGLFFRFFLLSFMAISKQNFLLQTSWEQHRKHTSLCFSCMWDRPHARGHDIQEAAAQVT